jgi:hypothetical protein
MSLLKLAPLKYVEPVPPMTLKNAFGPPDPVNYKVFYKQHYVGMIWHNSNSTFVCWFNVFPNMGHHRQFVYMCETNKSLEHAKRLFSRNFKKQLRAAYQLATT